MFEIKVFSHSTLKSRNSKDRKNIVLKKFNDISIYIIFPILINPTNKGKKSILMKISYFYAFQSFYSVKKYIYIFNKNMFLLLLTIFKYLYCFHVLYMVSCVVHIWFLK